MTYNLFEIQLSFIPWEVSFNLEAANCRPRSTSGGSIALAYTDTLKNFFFFKLAALGLCGCALAFSICGESGHSDFSLQWLLMLQDVGSKVLRLQ